MECPNCNNQMVALEDVFPGKDFQYKTDINYCHECGTLEWNGSGSTPRLQRDVEPK